MSESISNRKPLYACILGLSGQDGSFLTELLLEKGYNLYGMIRRNSTNTYPNIEHLRSKVNLMYGDVTDVSSITRILNTIFKKEGDNLEQLELYNLSAQSHVQISFEIPVYTGMVDAIGTLNILECIRQSKHRDKIRAYFAMTSELFGKVLETPQTEITPFNPVSPYSIAKQYGFNIVKNYRENYNLFLCNGILFNHSSTRRGKDFVCRKITMGVADIQEGKQDCLYFGNLNSRRDIGHSKDYVKGMWLMLQQDKPVDYLLATGETFTIRELVQMAFDVFEKKVVWEGKGLEEVGKVDDKVVIRVDPSFFRPSEVDLLLGDSSKARRELGWLPEYNTRDLIKEMTLHDSEQSCKRQRRD